MPAPCSLRLRCAVFPLVGLGSSLGLNQRVPATPWTINQQGWSSFDKDGPAGIGGAQLTSSRLMRRSHRYQGCVKDGRGDIKDPSRPMPSIRSLATLGGTAAYRRPQRAPGSRRVEGGIPTMSDAVYTLELLGVLLGVGLLARISHRQL
jgi:hypothetical protein